MTGSRIALSIDGLNRSMRRQAAAQSRETPRRDIGLC